MEIQIDSQMSSRFACDRCESSFSTKGNLTRHQRTSVKCSLSQGVDVTKRFQCPQCLKSFTRGDVLKEHLVTCSKTAPKVEVKDLSAVPGSNPQVTSNLQINTKDSHNVTNNTMVVNINIDKKFFSSYQSDLVRQVIVDNYSPECVTNPSRLAKLIAIALQGAVACRDKSRPRVLAYDLERKVIDTDRKEILLRLAPALLQKARIHELQFHRSIQGIGMSAEQQLEAKLNYNQAYILPLETLCKGNNRTGHFEKVGVDLTKALPKDLPDLDEFFLDTTGLDEYQTLIKEEMVKLQEQDRAIIMSRLSEAYKGQAVALKPASPEEQKAPEAKIQVRLKNELQAIDKLDFNLREISKEDLITFPSRRAETAFTESLTIEHILEPKLTGALIVRLFYRSLAKHLYTSGQYYSPDFIRVYSFDFAELLAPLYAAALPKINTLVKAEAGSKSEQLYHQECRQLADSAETSLAASSKLYDLTGALPKYKRDTPADDPVVERVVKRVSRLADYGKYLKIFDNIILGKVDDDYTQVIIDILLDYLPTQPPELV